MRASLATWILLVVICSCTADNVNYTYDAAGRLTRVSYPNGTAINYTYDKAGNLLSRVVGSGSGPVVNAVVNGASFLPGGVVPGEIATIFGANLTTSSGINLTSSLPLPTSFLNVSVTVNGSPAPLFAVDNVNGQQQINFQVPWEVAGKGNAAIAVINNGAAGAPVAVPVLSAQPAIFSYTVGSNTFGAILHANFQLADTAHPVSAGEVVLIYCTGLGPVSPQPQDGVAGKGEATVAKAAVSIGGANAIVQFSGLAPGFVGLNQINAQIPAGVSSGNNPVSITISGASSKPVLLPAH
jgi:uncharacterized protein (TIGR03437 family)